MGVHGLTTYLRDHQRALSQTINLPNSNLNVHIIVDGWSFIYALYQKSNLPWVYGGEYQDFCDLVQLVVRAWVKVGLKVFFVFDGAYPDVKFATARARVARSVIQPSLLFFRTSATARATSAFLHESRIIPPLVLAATLHALDVLKASIEDLQVFFADEEADPFVVELAGRVGAYVVGNDSDFVVLNYDGYLGYIPLEEMVWCASVQEDELHTEDNGFLPVKRSKTKKPTPRFGKGLIPLDSNSDATLSLTVYSPSSLAAHLHIPVSLLPLLAALAGNDYSIQSASQRNPQSLFFGRQATPSQRIVRIATTIHSVVHTPSNKRKLTQQISSVMDLISRTVQALLDQGNSNHSSGEINFIVNSVVESTIQYAIPRCDDQDTGLESLWPTTVCPLHAAEKCRLLPMISRNITALQHNGAGDISLQNMDQIRSLYLHAYRAGRLSPRIMDILHTSTCWPRQFLEHPDKESVGRTIGRTIRRWCYSVLDDALGLENRSEPEAASGEQTPPPDDDEDDEDELIDVAEESDEEGTFFAPDPLAPLKGALRQLHVPDSGDSNTSETSSSPRLAAKVVTEHIRRGTRLADEQVQVHPLLHFASEFGLDNITDVPLILQPEHKRFNVLLQALQSNYEVVRQLPSTHLLPVLALRWILLLMHDRAQESGSMDKKTERWTQKEARCILAGFFSNRAMPEKSDLPPMMDRNIQLVAQMLMAIESIHHFSQILLLSESQLATTIMFSGKSIHMYLADVWKLQDSDVSPALWDASVHGLEHTLAVDRRQISRNKSKALSQEKREVVTKLNGGAPKSIFALLSDAEA